jgi:hypothetical protein
VERAGWLLPPYPNPEIKYCNENRHLRYAAGQKGETLYLVHMERAITPPDPIFDQVADGTPKAQTCKLCSQEKPYTPQHWPAERGHATGLVCRLCARDRKRDFDRKYKQTRVAARTHDLASLAATPATPTATKRAVSTSRDAKKSELPIRALDVAKALRAGAESINAHAQDILTRVLGYAADPTSTHHEWALKLIAERVIPRKLYEDLGSQAAGIKAGQGAVRPAVTIIVQPAALPAQVEPVVRVIEGERLS